MEYKLRDLYKVSNGLSKGGSFFGSGFPFISFSTVFNNFFVPEEINDFVQSTLKEQVTYSIKKGDILITRTSETIDELGMSCVALKDYPTATFNGFCKRLRPLTDKVYPHFIGYYLRTPYFRSNFTKVASLITRASLRNEDLLRFSIELPPIYKQKKIAEILYSYDNLIENNNKRIKLLGQMAENLYKEWFVRFRFPGYEHVEFESGIPKGWEILRANQLFDITIGKTPDRKIFEYFSNIPECNYPWISISDMRSASTFVFKTKEYLTFNAVNTCNVKIIPKNTVLVSFKLTVGQVAITTSDMCTNEAIAHFTTDNATMREYIYLYLKKFQYSDLGNTSSIGTAVNSKIIKNMKIILPSSELLNRFHDYVYSIFEEIRLLNETSSNLTKQRDMLLPRLMSGKLEV